MSSFPASDLDGQAGLNDPPEPKPPHAPEGEWFSAAAHAYYSGKVRWPSVTQALVRARLIDYSGVPETILKAAQARGQRVHRALHFHCQNDLDPQTLGPQTAGYVAGAINWLEQTGFVAENVEQPLFDHVRKFGGTPDLRGHFPDGSLGIPDWKTGITSPGHRLQLAAYASMLPEPRRWRRIVVYLRPDGNARAIEFPAADYMRDLSYFYSALQCCWWAIENKAMNWGWL